MITRFKQKGHEIKSSTISAMYTIHSPATLSPVTAQTLTATWHMGNWE